VPVLAGEGALGAPLAQDGELLRREAFPPRGLVQLDGVGPLARLHDRLLVSRRCVPVRSSEPPVVRYVATSGSWQTFPRLESPSGQMPTTLGYMTSSQGPGYPGTPTNGGASSETSRLALVRTRVAGSRSLAEPLLIIV